MKTRVARTLKWNTVDRVTTQLLYAVTGVILANQLTQEDFGLVGAVLVFQSFASMLVDSGFSYALLQRKHPSDTDYSTVFWFNMAVSTALYALLFAGASLIARCFDDDYRLIPLSRVMLLSLIINAASIVQVNILTKKLDIRMVAVSNTIGMVASATVGISLAIAGYGAWAVVWQTLTLGIVKSSMLWLTNRWRPTFVFSWTALRSYFRVGFGVMGSAWLNVLFQNINSIFIGNRNGMASLGYYTQADKWSKMGVASLSQILNTSFLPALSQYQDSPAKFAAATSKMNRLTAYLVFPGCIFLAVMAPGIFHVLFGDKWDPSVILFQLLLIRGIFVVIAALYNNYLIALGRARLMIYSEALRDGLMLLAIIVTLPYIALETDGDITRGLQIFILGQVIAAFVAWMVMLVMVARLSYRTPWQFVADLLPYLAQAIAVACLMWLAATLTANPWMQILVQGSAGLAMYTGINIILKSKIQRDMLDYILKRNR